MRLALLIVLLFSSLPALAAEETRPWAVGVSPERQEEALRLFQSGNEAYARPEYVEAARLFREALTRWDHPAIHGNLAAALIHLDDPVEAHEHLTAALRFGKAPFDENVFQQLEVNRKLLVGQLGRVEVENSVPEAVVTLDGKPLIVGPGNAWRFVRAGEHQVVARKPSHLTFTSQVTVLPERPAIIRVVLVPLSEAGGTERRMAVWKPWVVFGAGAALALIGAGLEIAAQANISEYEREISRSCPVGCDPSTLAPAVRDLVDRAQVQHGVAIGSFAAGGAALVTGSILAYLNRPRRVRVDESGRRVSLLPLIWPAGVGLRASF